MKRSEITWLSALTLVGALMGTLPSWPATQPPTIVRMKPDVLPEHATHRDVWGTLDAIRAIATALAVAPPLGFVDVKACAIDETWSGLKLVARKELR